MAEVQLVVFSLNNEQCGADTLQVQEIVKYQEATKIPEMPKFIEGIINLRGKVVPVINLNKRFELGETAITGSTKIIVTKINESYVGFMVNDVSEIIRLNDEEIEVTPEIIQKTGSTYLRGVGKKGQQLISILDLPAILTHNEAEKIESLDIKQDNR